MIIDTHCHYDMMESPEDYINKVENTGNIVIGMTNLPSHFAMGNEHIRNFKKVRLALGFHPQLADEHKVELPLFAKYNQMLTAINNGERIISASNAHRKPMSLFKKSLYII